MTKIIRWPWVRAPWCRCGHYRDIHDHYSYGTFCSRCDCPRFTAPLIRRRP